MTAAVDAVRGLAATPEGEVHELMAKASLGYWTQYKMGLTMAPFHWEWCRLRQKARRIAIVAPREHAKSETFTVHGTAWESVYQPGLYTFIFCEAKDQAKEMLAKIRATILVVAPELIKYARTDSTQLLVLANFSRIRVAGSGSAVRGAHPDVIVGDDVLNEGSAGSSKQREQVRKWWFGAITGMAHPGTLRTLGEGENAQTLWFPPTRIYLVGTPFHQQDLLVGMKENPVWSYRRYAAEYDPGKLVPGSMAIEVR